MIIRFSKTIDNHTQKQITALLSAQGAELKWVNFPGSQVLSGGKHLSAALLDQLRIFDPLLSFTEISTPYQLASLAWKKEPSVIRIKNTQVGGADKVIMAGPCAVESEEQLYTIAAHLKSRGVTFLRGGAYKPRTSPYAFQGLKNEGLKILKKVATELDMLVVTEVMDLSLLEEVYDYSDVLQIGTRNMFNYQFLKELGKVDKPVLLKRGFSAKIDEWLLAAEYILLGGNEKVILCERGIRTFETEVRNTFDIAAISLLKELSHLPVIADPSQGTGIRSLVKPTSLASIAAGADGLIVEVHHDPANAFSDGQQSLNLQQFDDFLLSLRKTFTSSISFDFEKNSVNFTPVS